MFEMKQHRGSFLIVNLELDYEEYIELSTLHVAQRPGVVEMLYLLNI